jgi:hypothetical protein
MNDPPRTARRDISGQNRRSLRRATIGGIGMAALGGCSSPAVARLADVSVLDVACARTVMVIKRGMSAGFAGVENELYFQDKTSMIFGSGTTPGNAGQDQLTIRH